MFPGVYSACTSLYVITVILVSPEAHIVQPRTQALTLLCFYILSQIIHNRNFFLYD